MTTYRLLQRSLKCVSTTCSRDKRVEPLDCCELDSHEPVRPAWHTPSTPNRAAPRQSLVLSLTDSQSAVLKAAMSVPEGAVAIPRVSPGAKRSLRFNGLRAGMMSSGEPGIGELLCLGGSFAQQEPDGFVIGMDSTTNSWRDRNIQAH